MTRTPAISACMIVKNEEEMLPGCLASIAGVADEIIIVDTGSTDNTLEIARQYTDRIYCHPWEQDFAKHRNQSIGYASGEWLFVIDADERLRGPVEPLERAIQNPLIDGVALRIVNPCAQNTICFDSTRIFRNHCGYRYEGIVHNQLTGPKRVVRSEAEILHLGYDRGDAATLEKFGRTASLLKEQIEADPENIFALINLAVSCLTVRKIEEALEYSARAVSLTEKKEARNPLFRHAYLIRQRILLQMNRFTEAAETGAQSLRRFGPDPDILSGLVLAGVGRRDWHAAAAHGNAYLGLDAPGPNRLIEPFPEWRILAWIASACAMTGKAEQAQALFERALDSAPDRNGLAIEIGGVFFQAGHHELGLAYLSRPFGGASRLQDTAPR